MSAMEFTQGSWARFSARSIVLSGAIAMGIFVGLKLANAGPGEPVRKALTVSGVLTGAPTSAMATFRFYRTAGDATPLCAPEVAIRAGMERDATSGAFSVEVPLDQSGHVCPDALFHDPSAFVEVLIGSTVVVTRRSINPVPYAVYAQQYGAPDCPVGYERNPTAVGFGPGMRLCQRYRSAQDGGAPVAYDEVVRVGTGPSAFWIDRWEASAFSQPDGSGVAYGGLDGMPLGLPENGQWHTSATSVPPVYAVSRVGTQPLQRVTWFQANEACAASGKRLPTSSEWLRAAQGTPDPRTPSGDSGGSCRTLPSTAVAWVTGSGTNCISAWGAQDMIGNLEEFTVEWGGSLDYHAAHGTWPSGSTSTGDSASGVASVSQGEDLSDQLGIPAVIARGGHFQSGTGAGVFEMDWTTAPYGRRIHFGFRCVIPR